MTKRLAIFIFCVVIWVVLDVITGEKTDLDIILIIAFFLTWAGDDLSDSHECTGK